MEKIELIATEIYFTFHSIIYRVKFKNEINASGIVFCINDIKDKDLILKQTMIDKNNMEVVFTPCRVMPHFYQSIIDGTIRNIDEHATERKDIYSIGDVVGYILI